MRSVFLCGKKVCFSVTFIIMKLPMPADDIRISGARSRMDMLPDYFEAAATSKNWKIALQLKLRNFCMRPARRIIDTGRASYVWAECATALIMVEFSEGKFIVRRELFLTKSSVNRVEKNIPFCDRGVFRMFISSTASCTYKKYTLLHITLFL